MGFGFLVAALLRACFLCIAVIWFAQLFFFKIAMLYVCSRLVEIFDNILDGSHSFPVSLLECPKYFMSFHADNQEAQQKYDPLCFLTKYL